MALWTGLGQAATVAQQLVGADVGGLISMIVQAARTARQNKSECEKLARRVLMIAQLLPHVQDPEAAAPLAGLGDTLRDAHELVVSCQGRSVAYQFIMAGRQAEMFKEVQSKIDSYLILFPMISHIVITRRLDRILNVHGPDDSTSGEPSPLPPLPQLQESTKVAHGISNTDPYTARIGIRSNRDVRTVKAIQCISKADMQSAHIRDYAVHTAKAMQCISKADMQSARIHDCAVQTAKAIQRISKAELQSARIRECAVRTAEAIQRGPVSVRTGGPDVFSPANRRQSGGRFAGVRTPET